MLREISFPQLQDWMEYDCISPIGDKRGDWQAAAICSTVTNMALAGAGLSRRAEVEDFLLEFTSQPKERQPKPEGRTWQEMQLIARMMTAKANAAPGSRKRRR
jgi:hypothetical protein